MRRITIVDLATAAIMLGGVALTLRLALAATALLSLGALLWLVIARRRGDRHLQATNAFMLIVGLVGIVSWAPL